MSAPVLAAQDLDADGVVTLGWGRHERRSGVNAALMSRRVRRVVENDDFAAFARRIVAAHGRRIASGDVEGLRELAALDQAVQDAIRTAVAGLRFEGFSWAEIGDRLGISRQAAQQRWGAHTD